MEPAEDSAMHVMKPGSNLVPIVHALMAPFSTLMKVKRALAIRVTLSKAFKMEPVVILMMYVMRRVALPAQQPTAMVDK